MVNLLERITTFQSTVVGPARDLQPSSGPGNSAGWAPIEGYFESGWPVNSHAELQSPRPILGA